MGAAFRRRDRLDARRLGRGAGIVVHQARRAGPAGCVGQQQRAGGAIDRDAPHVLEIDRAAERLDGIAGGAPPIAWLLVDRGAVLARRGQRDGGRADHALLAIDGAGAHAAGADIDAEEQSRHVAARIGAGAGSFRPTSHRAKAARSVAGQMQAMLGAAVEDVLRGARPLGAEQEARFTLIELCAEMRAEIGQASRAFQQRGGARAVEPAVMQREVAGQPGELLAEGSEPAVEILHVAAGQRRARGPRLRHAGEERAQLVERMLRQLAIGRDLAAEDRQDRRRCAVRQLGIDVEDVVARHRRGILGVVVIERPDTGEAVHDVGAGRRAIEIAREDGEQVVDLAIIDRGVLRLALDRDVGGADQRQVALVRIDEDHALVVVLQQVGLVAVPELAGDDVAALHQADAAVAGRAVDAGEHILHPRPRRIDDAASAHGALSGSIAQLDGPGIAVAPGRQHRRARADVGAARLGIERVEHDQAGIVDPAVRIFEGARVGVLDRLAHRIAGEVDGAGGGQFLAAAEMVVEKEAEAHQPGRALLRRMRQHEAHGPDDVRRGVEQHLALDQRLAHQAELVVFEIAQAAMHQLAAARGGALRQVVFLAQQHAEPPPRRIARYAGAVDAAADDEEVVGSHAVRPPTNVTLSPAMRPGPGATSASNGRLNAAWRATSVCRGSWIVGSLASRYRMSGMSGMTGWAML